MLRVYARWVGVAPGGLRWVLAWGSALTSCSAPANDYVPELMPTVESRPGVVQNGGSSDEWMSEGETCVRYRDALVRRNEALNCSISVPRCPELVRPAASLTCVVYSAPSLLTCERYFEQATECAQVRSGSCLLTAVIDYSESSCGLVDAATPDLEGGHPSIGDAGLNLEESSDGDLDSGSGADSAWDAARVNDDSLEGGTLGDASTGAADAGPDAGHADGGALTAVDAAGRDASWGQNSGI